MYVFRKFLDRCACSAEKAGCTALYREYRPARENMLMYCVVQKSRMYDAVQNSTEKQDDVLCSTEEQDVRRCTVYRTARKSRMMHCVVKKSRMYDDVQCTEQPEKTG